jgi:hypothetical protein
VIVARPYSLVVGVVIALLAGTGVALAAPVALTSARLTVSTSASTVQPTTCTLVAAAADSYVNQQSAGSNQGNATTLDVRAAPNGIRRTFVRFDLGTCSIPASALVTTADLMLFMYDAPPASRTYLAHRVTGAWTETGVTWANQPATVAAATASVTTGTTANVTRTWDVTADVQAFVDGTTNLGWRLRDETESAPVRLGSFRSTEHGNASERPVLEVTYYQ